MENDNKNDYMQFKPQKAKQQDLHHIHTYTHTHTDMHACMHPHTPNLL